MGLYTALTFEPCHSSPMRFGFLVIPDLPFEPGCVGACRRVQVFSGAAPTKLMSPSTMTACKHDCSQIIEDMPLVQSILGVVLPYLANTASKNGCFKHPCMLAII